MYFFLYFKCSAQYKLVKVWNQQMHVTMPLSSCTLRNFTPIKSMQFLQRIHILLSAPIYMRPWDFNPFLLTVLPLFLVMISFLINIKLLANVWLTHFLRAASSLRRNTGFLIQIDPSTLHSTEVKPSIITAKTNPPLPLFPKAKKVKD